MRTTTETTCHCGAEFNGSDHCSGCGCEQFEAECDRTHECETADDYTTCAKKCG